MSDIKDGELKFTEIRPLKTIPYEAAYPFSENKFWKPQWGLTKREWLIGMALQGILSNTIFNRSRCNETTETIVNYAIDVADAQIKAINK